MFHTRGLPRGVPLSLQSVRALQHAAPLDEGTLDRLLSRAEIELAEPKAVRRRETIALLKLASASTKAERAQEALGTSAAAASEPTHAGQLAAQGALHLSAND